MCGCVCVFFLEPTFGEAPTPKKQFTLEQYTHGLIERGCFSKGSEGNQTILGGEHPPEINKQGLIKLESNVCRIFDLELFAAIRIPLHMQSLELQDCGRAFFGQANVAHANKHECTGPSPKGR